MDFYNEKVKEALDQNAINEGKWKDYKQTVGETRKTVNTFVKSYKMEVMVPLGKKAFVRGTLQHTNDVLVSHSSNYFSAVSNYQANEILQRRNKICEQKLKELDAEKDLFRGKLDVSTNDAFSEQEIIEEYNEEAEAEWRKRHRESIRKQKLEEAEERKTQADNKINDLLDQYELIEEMTGELESLEQNEDYDYDTLLKFISGEKKVPESKKRVAHDVDLNEKKASSEIKVPEIKSEEIKLQNAAIPVEESKPEIIKDVEQQELNNNKENQSIENSESKKKKSRRKVRFSTSLEDVKIIEEATSGQTAFPPIQITFEHSNERFNPDIYNGVDDDVKFKHPGEFIKILNTIDSEHPKQKSILKETNYKYSNNVNPKLQSNAYVDEDIYDSLSKFPLICGEVIERKTDDVKLINENEKTGKKVSKFKVLRSKIK
ncbi:unconventional prefoldin RPB5 interactor-like protein [Chironomus tepperi]|uniref:unconventional prefoldin RPB5 interactor-like protein n=1 Tax=Chironomus tepperi TaxID=113505 RepID=UPI00391F2BB9